MNRYFLRLLVMGLAVTQLRGDENESWQVRAEWMVVSVPTESALRLVPALRARKTVPRAVEEIEGMIGSGKATLHGLQVLWARDGERATSEEVDEVRYPTEFDPRPGGIGLPLVPAPIPAFVPQFPGINVPTAFDTLNAGLTLEIESKVHGRGKIITAIVMAKHHTLEQWRRVLNTPRDPKAGVYEQPQFRAFRTTTSIELVSGEWMLLGAYVIPKPGNQIELFLLRATAQSVTK